MNDIDKLNDLSKRYNIDINYINNKGCSIHSLANILIEEVNFLNSITSRMCNKDIGVYFSVTPKKIEGIYQFFAFEDYIYYLLIQKNTNQIIHCLKLALFCSKSVYISVNSTVDDAHRFMKLKDDKDFNYLLRNIGLTFNKVAIDSGDFYNNKVWDIVKPYFNKGDDNEQ